MENAGDSRRAWRGREDPSLGVEDHVPREWGASQTSISHPLGKSEYINIRSRQDELDPTVLRKLLALAAIATTSVHKYWISSFAKAADNTIDRLVENGKNVYFPKSRA
ncbi:hypothetical protein Fot_35448 [Forsythia ovata]|uniref:Uncharacterized protein n=1 Tax=Forsythia ovata TaxID=205694 RepID=A0ABD1SLU8_9LAMI